MSVPASAAASERARNMAKVQFDITGSTAKERPSVPQLSIRECALLAAKIADEKKATDIIVQEVGALISATEYFVIVTAANNRQVKAIVDEIDEQLDKQAGEVPLHRESTQDCSWELLDYGGFVVHVFQPETREFYRLEALWNEAPVIDLAAEAGLTDIEYSDRIAKLLENIKQAQAAAAEGAGADEDADDQNGEEAVETSDEVSE